MFRPRASFTQARELLDALAVSHADDHAISSRLGAALCDEAVAVAEMQKPEAALQLLSRSVETLTPLGEPASAGPRDRERLSEALWQLARIYRACGNLDDAGHVDAKRLALWKARPASELAELAL